MANSKEKIAELRRLISASKLDAYIIPMNDEFMNEYMADYAKRIEFLTGFTGSNATVVVTKNSAAFFTDGRYTLQAESEVDSKIYEIKNISEETTSSWLLKELKPKAKVGFDPWLTTENNYNSLSKNLSLKEVKLTASENLVDKIWKNKPAKPKEKVRIHQLKFSGVSSAEKRKIIAEDIKKSGAKLALITATDSIAWLLNIRGSDVKHTPIALSFLILKNDGSAKLFIDEKKVSSEVKKFLGSNIIIKPINEVVTELQKNKLPITLDPSVTTKIFFDSIAKSGAKLIKTEDPCQLRKAIKNKIEISRTINAHIRDGASVTKFIYWVKNNYKKLNIDEISAEKKLFDFRKSNQSFMDLSFPTICGFKSNGAIVHYRSNAKTNKKIVGDGILLVDSGAQYLDGTTDITRTISIGKPAKEQKENFTRVLKGHIAIATLKFPEGTTGGQIDVLARAELWKNGLDYDHGTGHGVGSYLSVHEGPQRISKISNVSLQPGMILSNEPGFYKDGEYGIRIENLVLVVDAGIKYKNRKFLSFETLTQAPIDVSLISKELLSKEEVEWVNKYNSNALSKISRFLNSEEKNWLEKQKV